ncbi:hypothetical protein U1Q18_039709 [Sarracenia purpurea var. burkii]
MPPVGLGPTKAARAGSERRIVPAQSLLILRRSGDAPRKHLCVFPLSGSYRVPSFGDRPGTRVLRISKPPR